jgi:AcrR family transcriptional regulator
MSSSATTPGPTPAERRRVQQREEARRAILEATEVLLVEDGYEAFSMRRLASRCGYTAPTIYHHFGDKQGLLDAVLEGGLRQLLGRLRSAGGCSDPAETVRAMLAEFARFGMEHPIQHRLLSMHRPDGSSLPPVAEEISGLFEVVLSELASAGRLRGGDVEQALQFVWMLIHGIVSLRIGRPDVEWKESIVDYSLRTALHGLVTPAPSDPPARPERSGT